MTKLFNEFSNPEAIPFALLQKRLNPDGIVLTTTVSRTTPQNRGKFLHSIMLGGTIFIAILSTCAIGGLLR